MIDVVCFDLDDTLCDYGQSARLSRKRLFEYAVSKRNGFTLNQFQTAYYATLQGMMREQGSRIFLRLNAQETRFEHLKRVLQILGIFTTAFTEDLVEYYHHERRRTLQLFPDAQPVLNALRDRYPLSLLTNGPSDCQREEIDDLRIADYFDHIVVAGEVGYVKPDVEIFNILIDQYAVPANRLLYVGNSQEEDLIGARNSGFHVAWLNRDHDALRSGIPTPDYTLHTLTELLPILAVGADPRA